MQLSQLTVTKDDFNNCEWQEVISQCQDKQCHTYFTVFTCKAEQVSKSGDKKAENVFTLLREVCSFLLRPDSPSTPFEPVYRNYENQTRTSIPNDLTGVQLQVLKEIAPEITDPEMRARIADVLWVRTKDYKMGILAFDSYLESSKILEASQMDAGDGPIWVCFVDRIKRAFRIAVSSGRNSASFPKAVSYVESVLARYDSDKPHLLSISLMELLLEHRAGDPDKYASLAGKYASYFDSLSNYEWARHYLEIEAKWHGVADNKTAEVQCREKLAQSYEKEADQVLSSANPSHVVASQHLEKAIEAHRRIGSGKDLIETLHKKLLQVQMKVRSEMQVISGEVSTKELVDEALSMVRGKTLKQALIVLATGVHIPSINDLEQQAKDGIRETPLQYLIGATLVNEAGKVIGRRSEMSSGDKENSDTLLKTAMLDTARFYQHSNVSCFIEPVRRQIIVDHRVTRDPIYDLVSDNPFVPAGREDIYARGLLAGFEGNFLNATSLLMPQIENSVRYVLSQHKIITSKYDSDGIQEEYDLNRLLYMPELKAILGENLVFNLQGLLVERFGSNLRNRFAHGLMNYSDFLAASSIYFWWIMLHLCSVPKLISPS